MDAVEKDVRLLVKKELRAANQNFPMFRSAHEGWAVIWEEMSEAEAERYLLDRWIEERLWNEVKEDLQIPKEDLKEMQHRAVHMAVEAIQLAAMICKLERSQRRWKKERRENRHDLGKRSHRKSCQLVGRKSDCQSAAQQWRQQPYVHCGMSSCGLENEENLKKANRRFQESTGKRN